VNLRVFEFALPGGTGSDRVLIKRRAALRRFDFSEVLLNPLALDVEP